VKVGQELQRACKVTRVKAAKTMYQSNVKRLLKLVTESKADTEEVCQANVKEMRKVLNQVRTKLENELSAFKCRRNGRSDASVKDPETRQDEPSYSVCEGASKAFKNVMREQEIHLMSKVEKAEYKKKADKGVTGLEKRMMPKILEITKNVRLNKVKVQQSTEMNVEVWRLPIEGGGCHRSRFVRLRLEDRKRDYERGWRTDQSRKIYKYPMSEVNVCIQDMRMTDNI
jgi:hypothetical protein